MNIFDMKYRTKTYLAGDWTGDSDLIQKIKEWNDNNRLALNFVDVHEFTSSKDTSLNCSIKKSLRQRMNISKTFVLVVGKNTKSLRSGSCSVCQFYSNSVFYNMPSCDLRNSIDNKSYIQYECSMAYNDYLKGELKNIVVIYNGLACVDKTRCPEILKNVGTHIPSVRIIGGLRYWNYQAIKDAICK